MRPPTECRSSHPLSSTRLWFWGCHIFGAFSILSTTTVYFGQAAKKAFRDGFSTKMRRLFIPETPPDARRMQAPLTRAMLSRNDDLLEAVYDAYETLPSESGDKERWTRQQVIMQIRFIRMDSKGCHIPSFVEKGDIPCPRPCFFYWLKWASCTSMRLYFAGSGTNTRRDE